MRQSPHGPHRPSAQLPDPHGASRQAHRSREGKQSLHDGELIARLEDSFKNTIQATMPPAQGHLVSRSSLPTIHLSKDGKSQEISLHDLARAIASEMQKPGLSPWQCSCPPGIRWELPYHHLPDEEPMILDREFQLQILRRYAEVYPSRTFEKWRALDEDERKVSANLFTCRTTAWWKSLVSYPKKGVSFTKGVTSQQRAWTSWRMTAAYLQSWAS